VGLLRELKNLFAFLTVLPLRMNMDCLADSAKLMFLFPLVGAFVGLLAGVFGWVLFWLLVPGLVVGGLVLGMLLLLTGLHHTDGLLDFGDGVMAQGTAERKIEVMHDQLTGAGGLALGIVTLMVTAFALGELRMGLVIQSVVVVEVAAKLSMVVGAWAGKAVHSGMNSPFLEAMHGSKGDARLVAALVISFAIAIPLLWLVGAVIIVTAVIAGLVMVAISHRHFNGVTGDVFGAMNELTRLVCLVVVVAMI